MASLSATQEMTAKPEETTVQVGPPPAYEMPAAGGNSNSVPTSSSYTPPAYEVATKLPSYDEAERTKESEAGLPPQPPCPDRAARQNRRANGGAFFFWSGPGLLLSDTRRGAADGNLSHAQLQQQVLGSELEFLCCFLVALLFNWIGLFAALCCLTVTIAGRAGAISGFGLSVVKWAFLVMHQTYITREALGWTTSGTMADTSQLSTIDPVTGIDNSNDVLQDSKWFTVSCWLIVALGLLCFLQGIVHYVRAKRYARDYNWLRQRYNTQPF